MAGYTAKSASRNFRIDHPHALLCPQNGPAMRLRVPNKEIRIAEDLIGRVCGAPLSKLNKPT